MLAIDECNDIKIILQNEIINRVYSFVAVLGVCQSLYQATILVNYTPETSFVRILQHAIRVIGVSRINHSLLLFKGV